MRIKRLQLIHFRNYDQVDIHFSPAVNIFIGENAQGKTNILEAIYLLALVRSHRAKKDKEMIQWDQDFGRVEGEIENQRSTFPLEIILSPKGKMAKFNHLEQERLSAYIGHFNVILFAPEDLDIVKGSPAVRRRFLDMELGQMQVQYLHHLSEYNHILKQRNQYLKWMRQDSRQVDPLYFDILTEQLALEGAQVLSRRLVFIQDLNQWSQPIHHTISNGKEDLSISYQSTLPLLAEDSYEDIDSLYDHFVQALKEDRDREIHQGSTAIGPHRDDMIFNLNGRLVQTYGSQGQQRTTALSVRLAEIDLMKEKTGEYPVLLLDDVLSELDDDRQTHLLKAIEGRVQTFLTTTSLDGVHQDLIDDPKIFKISGGEIETE